MTAAITLQRPPQAAPRRRHRPALLLVLVAIGVVAALVRLSIMIRGGGIDGLGAYDDGVYYGAADALVHGRLPYRDFLFIQPPLIAVVTAPFAALGAVLGDPTGFALARVAFIAIGGVNAALCGAVLRRLGWTAVVVGGLGYALAYPAVYAERSVLLEPLGTLGGLLAILLLQHAPAHRGLAVAAGVAAGLSAGAKIWYIVPVALLLLAAPRLRLRYLIGVAIGGCAIYLPFLLAAPQRMVQEVVLDQLGRRDAGVPGWHHRLVAILGVRGTAGVHASMLLPIVVVLAIAAVVTALATPGARTFGVLAIAAVAVLLLTPSWFGHYTALAAPPLVLCLGVGAGRLAGLLPARRARAVLAAAVVLGVLGGNLTNDLLPYGTRTPAGLAAASEAVRGCITGDDPGTLIEMDVLSRDLRDPGCAVWPDVTGWTYDPRDLARTADGTMLARPLNERWQDDGVAFMRSGDATIRTRSATGWSVASKREIDSGRVLFRLGRFVVHATDRA